MPEIGANVSERESKVGVVQQNQRQELCGDDAEQRRLYKLAERIERGISVNVRRQKRPILNGAKRWKTTKSTSQRRRMLLTDI